MGSGGCAHSGVQRQSPWSGVRGGAKPPERPEAEEVFIFQSLVFDVHVILYTGNYIYFSFSSMQTTGIK